MGNELYELYREVFSTPKGQIVLFHMLEDLGAFDIATTEQEITLRNYAVRLQQIVGGGRFDQTSVMTFLNQLMRQPLSKEEKREE